MTSLLVGCSLSSPQFPRTAHYAQNFHGFSDTNSVYTDRFTAEYRSPDYIDPEPYVQKALNTKLNLDPRIVAQRNSKSPSAAAALEYMHQIASNDICAHSTEAFLEMILNGATPEEANAEATRVFIQEHNRGQKADSGSACEASIQAWQNAEKKGQDPILASAIAFMKNHPNVKNGNPCAVSGVDYVKAVVDGKSHAEANRIAANSFASTLIKAAQRGDDMRDPACAAATKAFFHALPEKPSPPNAAAMMAFIDKTFSTQKFSYDPICWKSTEAFFTSYDAGNDELTNNLAAAEAFLVEFAKGIVNILGTFTISILLSESVGTLGYYTSPQYFKITFSYSLT